MEWLVTLHLFLASLPVALWGSPSAERHLYRVVEEASHVWIVTHRSGLLSFLGHEHAIVPGEWSARLCLSDPVRPGDEASLTVTTSSLVIDADSARALAGLGDGPGTDDRREIQRKMLDAEHLDTERFPEARLELRAVGEAAEELRARGTLALHGVERELAFPLRVEPGEGGSIRLSGEVGVRQRDFGIEPESIAGVVKVSDEVDLHFSLVVAPTGETCASGRPGPDGADTHGPWKRRFSSPVPRRSTPAAREPIRPGT